MVQHRKKPGGVDAHQPVRLGPAEGRLMQPVIVCTGAEMLKALPDGGILHAADPQPLHGFLAARQIIDAAENQFSLAPSVAGVHHLGHVRGVHQLFQNVELLFLVCTHHHLPMFRQDGQVIVTPLGIVGVVGGGIRQTGQMTHAPADAPAVSFQITVFAGRSSQHGRE